MEGTAEERLQARLMSLWSELPDDERPVLLNALARADDASAEVSGFAMGPSAVSLLGPDVQSQVEIAMRKAGGDPRSSGRNS